MDTDGADGEELGGCRRACWGGVVVAGEDDCAVC